MGKAHHIEPRHQELSKAKKRTRNHFSKTHENTHWRGSYKNGNTLRFSCCAFAILIKLVRVMGQGVLLKHVFVKHFEGRSYSTLTGPYCFQAIQRTIARRGKTS